MRFFHTLWLEHYPRRLDQHPAPILVGREVGFDLFPGDLAIQRKEHPPWGCISFYTTEPPHILFQASWGRRLLESWQWHSNPKLTLPFIFFWQIDKKISSVSCCLLLSSEDPDIRWWPPDVITKCPKFRVCHSYCNLIPRACHHLTKNRP